MRWWLIQQESEGKHVLFSAQDIRNNSKLNIDGAVTARRADRWCSPGRDLRVSVPVLTHAEERLCIYESFSRALLLQKQLIMLWPLKGATQYDSTE